MRITTVLRLAVLFAVLGIAGAWAQDWGEYEVPFVPTPEPVVAEMLKLAKLTPRDVLFDLGSGDGRIVITAAKTYGVHAVGVDINPERIKEARENAKKAGVESLVEFRQCDLFQADISKASVVTMYLLPSVNLRLRPKLWHDLKPGSRLVSHDFDMGDWKAEKESKLEHHTIYFWTIPADARQRATAAEGQK